MRTCGTESERGIRLRESRTSAPRTWRSVCRTANQAAATRAGCGARTAERRDPSPLSAGNSTIRGSGDHDQEPASTESSAADEPFGACRPRGATAAESDFRRSGKEVHPGQADEERCGLESAGGANGQFAERDTGGNTAGPTGSRITDALGARTTACCGAATGGELDSRRSRRNREPSHGRNSGRRYPYGTHGQGSQPSPPLAGTAEQHDGHADHWRHLPGAADDCAGSHRTEPVERIIRAHQPAGTIAKDGWTELFTP